MKLLQLLSEPAVRCPGLAPTEWSCENNGTVDLELSGESDDVLLEHRRAKPSKCLACFADPRCDLSVKRSIAGVSYLLFLLLLFFFLQLYCPSGISPMGNSGCLPRRKPVATESCYPTYGAC